MASGLEIVLWCLGLTLVGYIVLSVFGLVSHGPELYVNFALGVVALSGVLAMIEANNQAIESGYRLRVIVKSMWAVLATVSGLTGLGYFRINVESLVLNAPFFSTTDITFGYFTIFSMIVLTWLHWGWLLAMISAASIAYFFFGDLIPIPLLQHPGYSVAFIMNYVSLNTNQGFFQFSGVAADQIYLLTFFGVTLLGVGMLRLVIEVGKLAGTHVKGGAALPAVIGSGAIGAVMGQAVSNVVLSGRLTIPMMKRYNYSAAMAGAIEATASSAGQILPPVLGLAGFLIASFLGIPYVTVAMAALIPGLLYLAGVCTSITVYALREDLPKLDESIDRMLIWRMLPTFLISFSVVIWLLLGYRSPGYAAIAGIVVGLVLALFQGRYRPNFKEIKEAFREGILLTTILSLLILAIGPLGQVMISTNLSGRLASLLATVLPDIELLLLIGAMLLSIVLGMGLPTPIAYVVASLAMIPFLQQVGVELLQAHFFVFYFAVFSTLTPPIAVSVLAATKLSGASFRSTAIHALKMAATTFIIPYAFIFNKELLSFPNVDMHVIMPIIEVLVTQTAVSIAAYGYCFKRLNYWERGVFWIVTVIGYWTLTTYGRPVILDLILVSSLVVAFVWMQISARAQARIVIGE
ncbi:MAG: C4-dicarboxylate ABC transporter [marine bacterium B5-7]|nr:MAG: C4-dicarboxylate ABC transporter [marine bacterium B5-7]